MQDAVVHKFENGVVDAVLAMTRYLYDPEAKKSCGHEGRLLAKSVGDVKQNSGNVGGL